MRVGVGAWPFLLGALGGLLTLGGCGPDRNSSADEAGRIGTPSPTAVIHYLGHASFLLEFLDGPTVLTDYGESNAYGLDSPVHSPGERTPDIVTLSHEHADHAGGALPEVIPVHLAGNQSYEGGGLKITPIPTYEGSLEAPDNTSFLFEYRGLKILHLGDCQGLMVALAEEGAGQEIRERIRTLYPDRYDAVLLPIGFVRNILEEAAGFVALLDAARVVPMHYWSPEDRDTFLELMDGRRDTRGRGYRVGVGAGSTLALVAGTPGTGPWVHGLTPAPRD